jgi:hypothetical protein
VRRYPSRRTNLQLTGRGTVSVPYGVVRHYELIDQAWAEIAPLLPPTGRPGGQWTDHRRVVNGILWKEVIQSQDQPEAEGSTGPVPEGNRPGHRPDTEQDKPDLERFRDRLAGERSDG